nr:UDP-N-acetylglucosamine 2-epimerase (non-hydrolyzing) [uncultured Acetatifactor sp.]
MKKILLAFGTRPEAIKMCPLVKELKNDKNIELRVCITGQHKEMLAQVLDTFHVSPDYDLAIMKENQSLFDITERVMAGMRDVLSKEKPDIVLVHGDTATSFAAALSSYYLKIPVGHVEAGLRTYNQWMPYPEEFNRQAVGALADLHFAPTNSAKNSLIREGKKEDRIFVTGNTVIDALKTTIRDDYSNEIVEWAAESRLVLLTAHRRENFGLPLRNMFEAIKNVIDSVEDVKILYPVHKNPAIRKIADEIFGNEPRIRLEEPMNVVDFHNIMSRSYMVLTDSGGIQEEAPALGKPVLVMRDTTERPEGVEAGTLKLVGTKKDTIEREFRKLLHDKSAYAQMANAVNPYGDGQASSRIARIIKDFLERKCLGRGFAV